MGGIWVHLPVGPQCLQIRTWAILRAVRASAFLHSVWPSHRKFWLSRKFFPSFSRGKVGCPRLHLNQVTKLFICQIELHRVKINQKIFDAVGKFLDSPTISSHPSQKKPGPQQCLSLRCQEAHIHEYWADWGYCCDRWGSFAFFVPALVQQTWILRVL